MAPVVERVPIPVIVLVVTALVVMGLLLAQVVIGLIIGVVKLALILLAFCGLGFVALFLWRRGDVRGDHRA